MSEACPRPALLALLWDVSEVLRTHWCRLHDAEALSVKGFDASAGIAGFVPRLHFLHPGHAPVPRRNRLRLRLPERVALCMKRRVQGAEGGGRRREV